MRRGSRIRHLVRGAVALALVGALVGGASAQGRSRPHKVPLPVGWQPEGISTAPRERGLFFAGSLATGAVIAGSLRTGRSSVLVPPHPGRVAVGLKFSRGLLFVAGGPTGMGFVYSARTGEDVAAFRFAPGDGSSFVNDVAVTRRAAWFTDSFRQRLYKVPIGPGRDLGRAVTVPLRGDIRFVAGQFNANGIVVAQRGKALIIVQSNTGRLFKVNAASGVATLVNLRGGSVVAGDGMLLDDGHRLWVAQNSNTLTRVRLDSGLTSGKIVLRRTDPTFDVPTTLAEDGDHLAIVNARFGTVPDPATADYWITQIPKPHI